MGERSDRVRIAQVLLLGHLRHGEMLGHQKGHQLAVLAAQPVGATEPAGIHGTHRGVVAAATFGDVMKERCDVQQPGPLKTGHQLAAERVLVRMLSHREAAQIAHHHQDVLIDRVHMKEVMLHAPDNASKGRQVAPQHRPLVHAPKLAGHPAGRLQ